MPAKYGVAALLAAAPQQTFADPAERWRFAVEMIFPGKIASQKKGCPKGAFLGLCEEGLVKGIANGKYTTSIDNKHYALRAVELLRAGDSRIKPIELWSLVMNGVKKSHNGQMDVVLALWSNGNIVR
jgi:hypothetical protein